ncbi:hypothetical protein BD410DRAFT_762259 [Rickenella mellea]|uniref:Rab-GAP TBC domain-containing protein n=1 Tax=Rickenella mellea TaxID=50990 RepID=A0A4Y7QIB7_9AGAM|nr:hypothetical protein BD410DRAFT_762259 [Rickenella mellea]
MSGWDSSKVKAQLRLAAQRLGQLQDRKDSSAKITRKDIATLLQTRNVPLARAKAQNLMKEDTASDLLEILEMHCGVLLEHFADLERSELSLSPAIVESASSIIHATPLTESKDLHIVRDMLIQRLGPDFTLSAVGNLDQHVSPKVLRAMNPPTSAQDLDAYMSRIAEAYNVNWIPEMRPHEKLNALADMLTVSNSTRIIDLTTLRRISSSGIPDHPPWLRPRVWKLLLGTLAPLKGQWRNESQKQRESYYDLIRRLLAPLESRSLPTTPPHPSDRALLDLFNSLTRVPSALFAGLDKEPENSSLNPLDESAPLDIKVPCAGSIDMRLALIQAQTAKDEPPLDITPEIRLESDSNEDSLVQNSSEHRQAMSSTIHPSQAYSPGGAHRKHTSALLRILFVHSSLHPADHSPHIASLLIPLYSVLQREFEPSDLAHAEADAFWLFEALVAEVAELEEEEGGNLWMRKFGDRLAWADPELHEDLHRKGLDPSLPHYSYRWLAPMLTHTVPLRSVLVIWDAVFSQPPRSRSINPKLEYLLDVCSALLIRARVRLARLGKTGRQSPSLWNEDGQTGRPLSPSRPWELGDAFMEGMAFLQMYPVEDAGGIERILQVAADLASKREEEAKVPKMTSVGLGAKLRETVWRGLKNAVPAEEAETSDDLEEIDDDQSQKSQERAAAPEPGPSGSGLASRLRNTVWRGITNQSSMDAPPSPLTPISPNPSPRMTPIPEDDVSPQASPAASTSLWSFAGKLKDSDMAAKLSKASTNLTVKAMGAWSVRKAPVDSGLTRSISKLGTIRFGSASIKFPGKREEEGRRGSLPNIDRADAYSPPPRPLFFRQPRDSWMPESKGPLPWMPTSPESVSSSATDNPHEPSRRSTLAAVTLQAPESKHASKSGPRPLLLDPTSLITPSTQNLITRSATNTPTPQPPQWADAIRGRAARHEAQSSVSSISTLSRQRNRKVDGRMDWDSDTSVSRIVRLNRGSVSPMAPTFRMPRHSGASSNSSFSEKEFLSPPQSESGHAPEAEATGEGRRISGWERVDLPDSPNTLPSSPPPRTPVTAVSATSEAVKVSSSERQRGSVVLGEFGELPTDAPALLKRAGARKSSLGLSIPQTEEPSELPAAKAKAPAARVRTKRYSTPSLVIADQRTPSPNSLVAPEYLADPDLAPTPRARDFPSMSPQERTRRPRKDETHEPRVRKISKESQVVRPRKISTDGHHRRTESAADEGDDEGYDELLSAYESEEGSHWGHLHD